MSDTSFLPGIVVLLIGLTLGLALAFRLRRTRGNSARSARSQDLRLEISDLLARRDDIYDRLKEAPGEELSRSERQQLEEAAASTLKQLDRLEARLPARESGKTLRPAEAPDSEPGPRRASRPALVGFASGAGLVALVAILFYWVGREAAPRPGSEPQPLTETDPVHAGAAELAPDLRQRVERLQARLRQEPTDVQARKALTETYVVGGLPFEAFQQTDIILQQFPEDADALYFQGLIRLTMGQTDEAIELLDRSLTQIPQHISALLVRGMAHLRRGDREQATADWRTGLDASGGSHPALENLLEKAEAGLSAEEILMAPVEPRPQPANADSPQETAVSVDAGASYLARVELSPGSTAPERAVLFLFLRPSGQETGPPFAVKRVPDPSFPVEIRLQEGDPTVAMASGSFPAEAMVTARLDADGNVSTAMAQDLIATAPAALGRPITLSLAVSGP